MDYEAIIECMRLFVCRLFGLVPNTDQTVRVSYDPESPALNIKQGESLFYIYCYPDKDAFGDQYDTSINSTGPVDTHCESVVLEFVCYGKDAPKNATKIKNGIVNNSYMFQTAKVRLKPVTSNIQALPEKYKETWVLRADYRHGAYVDNIVTPDIERIDGTQIKIYTEKGEVN